MEINCSSLQPTAEQSVGTQQDNQSTPTQAIYSLLTYLANTGEGYGDTNSQGEGPCLDEVMLFASSIGPRVH
jgi:hypothetical protein